MENEKEYYRLLKLQYYKATKEKIKDKLELNLNDNVYKWFLLRKEIGKKYLEYLNSLGYDVKNNNVAEIDKGNLDSLVKEYNTNIISPYIEEKENSKVLTYSLNVFHEHPILMQYGLNLRIEAIASIPKHIDTLMFNNPYEKKNMLKVENLINKGEFETIIGIYGQIFDKDVKKKTDMIAQILKKINNNNYKLDFEKDNGNYYSALVSKKKIIK